MTFEEKKQEVERVDQEASGKVGKYLFMRFGEGIYYYQVVEELEDHSCKLELIRELSSSIPPVNISSSLIVNEATYKFLYEFRRANGRYLFDQRDIKRTSYDIPQGLFVSLPIAPGMDVARLCVRDNDLICVYTVGKMVKVEYYDIPHFDDSFEKIDNCYKAIDTILDKLVIEGAINAMIIKAHTMYDFSCPEDLEPRDIALLSVELEPIIALVFLIEQMLRQDSKLSGLLNKYNLIPELVKYFTWFERYQDETVVSNKLMLSKINQLMSIQAATVKEDNHE